MNEYSDYKKRLLRLREDVDFGRLYNRTPQRTPLEAAQSLHPLPWTVKPTRQWMLHGRDRQETVFVIVDAHGRCVADVEDHATAVVIVEAVRAAVAEVTDPTWVDNRRGDPVDP